MHQNILMQPLRKKEEIDHVRLNTLKEYYFEETYLSYNKLFKISVKLDEEDEKLEKNITDHKYFVELENSNKILCEESISISRKSLKSSKYYSCNSVKIEVDYFHETFCIYLENYDRSAKSAQFRWVVNRANESYE